MSAETTLASAPQYMPINGQELEDLQFVYSLYRALKDSESLKERMTSIKMWWRWRGILKQLHGVFDATWRTIPPEKRDRINRIWSQQELRVVNSSTAVDPTGDMIMIPKKAVILMGQHCQEESCAICMGTNNERKDCLFRRGMVELSLPDLRKIEKKSGKCMGKLFDWRDQ